MAFLTSRSASKHILFALGVDPTGPAHCEGGVPTSESCKLHLRSVVRDKYPSMFPRYTSLVSPASQDVKQML